MSNSDNQRVQTHPPLSVFNPYTNQISHTHQHRPTHSSPGIQTTLPTIDDPDDTKWFGEKIHKSPNGFRLLLQNPRGIDTSNKLVDFGLTLEQMKRYKIDMLLLPETNVNSSNHSLIDNMKASTQLHLHHAHLGITNTPNFPPSTYQPGGVATVHHNKLALKTARITYDKAGRWVCNSFHGRFRTLKIYCLYRVCDNRDGGPSTAYSQQENFFLSQNRKVNPRNQVIDDLIDVLRSDIEKNVDIILAGDFNEKHNGKTAERLSELGLTNIIEEHIQNPPRTFKFGQNCIDHIWLSSTVASTVTSLGIAPFDFFHISDHRAIYIDLDFKEILDNNTFHIPPIHYRRLKLSSVSSVRNYIKSIRSLSKKHKLKKKIKKLKRAFSKYGPTVANIKLLNDIDSIITNIMLTSEQKCSKISTHCKTPWSPKLKAALKEYSKSKRLVRKLRKTALSSSDILQQATERRKQARLSLNEITKNAAEYRRQFLMQQAEFVASQRNTSTESEYKNLLRYEALRDSFRKIRYAHEGSFHGTVTSILIPDPCEYDNPQSIYDIEEMWSRIEPKNGKDINTWTKIEDKQTIESLLLKWMGRHNAQASDTPFASPEWQQRLSDPDIRSKILNGDIEDFHFDYPELQTFLSTFASSHSSQIPFTYSYSRFRNYIKKAREKLASSPSGRHMGHYKALLTMKDDTLLSSIYSIMELSMQYCVIPARFSLVALTLLEKEPGSPKIHRLRPIALVETELNCIAKAHWAQDLMKHIETNNSLTDDQYGGRSRRQAQSAVLNKVTYFDIQRQVAEPAIFIDKDARNCFDRFIPSLITLENETLGSPPAASRFMTSLLQQQSIRVKTIFGVSNQSISDVSNLPHFGSGQGIGWSGQACCASLNTVAKAMQSTCHSLSYTSPTRSIQVTTTGDCFVDDTELGINFEACPQRTSILAAAQQTDQAHTYFWNTTGGKVACDKGSWYYVDFVFISGKPVMIKRDFLPGELQTHPSFTLPPVTVPRLDIMQAHKTLGCLVAANGSQEPQFQELVRLSKKWASTNRTSGLLAKDILLSYYSRLHPQLTYRFSTSNLSHSQCETLMRIILPVLINAHHIQRHFKYSLAMAPPRYGGLNLTHHFYTLLFLKLQKFIYHIRQKDKSGKLLSISLETTQLQLGTSTPFFSIPHSTWSHLVTHTWSTHLFYILEKCYISVTYPSLWVPSPQRVNDHLLMDVFISHIRDPKTLYMLNACRIYLQVLSIADITSLDGTFLLSNIHEGENYRTSTLRWPTQKIPRTWWSVWSSNLTTYIAPLVHRNPLGNWTHSSHQQWKWRFSEPWLISPQQQFFLRRQSPSRQSNFYPSPYIPHIVDSSPADVTIHPSYVAIVSTHPIHPIPTPTPPTQDLSFLQYHPSFHHKGLTRILTLLRRGTLLTATDGSAFSGEKASFGFCLATPRGKKLYTNYGPVCGDAEYMASDRAELTALLSAISYLQTLIRTHSITVKKRLKIYTDSKISLALIKKSHNRISDSFTDHLDLILEIQAQLKCSSAKFHLIHVDSHQDKHTAKEYLPLPARLNIIADDTAALQYEQSFDEHLTDPQHLDAQIISFSSPHGRITSHFKEELVRFHRDPPTEQHIAKQWKIPETYLSQVSWKAIQSCMISQPRFSGAYTKILHNQWDTTSRKRKWGLLTDSTCPLCHSADESSSHIHSCPHPTLSQSRKKAHLDCISRLNNIQTAPILIRTFKNIFSHLNQQTPIHKPINRSTSIHRSLRRAFKSQKRLGFFNFSKGIVSVKWAKVQEKYCKENKLRFHPSWTNKLASSLIQYTHTTWKHRCSILHAEQLGTMDAYYRDSAQKLFDELKLHPERLEFSHRNLLRRRTTFFTTGNISSIRMWHRKAITSLEYRRKKNTNLGADIRNWILTRPYDPGRRTRGARVPNCQRLFRLR